MQTTRELFAKIWIDTESFFSDAFPLFPSAAHLVKSTSRTNREVALKNVLKFYTPVESDSSPSVEDRQPSPLKVTTGTLLKEHDVFKSMILAIIKDCQTKLSLLITHNKAMIGEVRSRNLDYLTPHERFGGSPQFGDRLIGTEYTDQHKLQTDVKILIAILKELHDEIAVFSDASCLQNFIDTYRTLRADAVEIFADYAEKKSTFAELQRAVATQKDNFLKKMMEIDLQVKAELIKFKDMTEYDRERMSYIKKWEAARVEQNMITLRKKEGKHESTITTMSNRLMMEEKCHLNLLKYLQESNEEMLQSIENWMVFYDKEVDDKDVKILNLNNDIYKLKEEKEKLQEQYDKRVKDVEDWLEYKRIKKEKEERLALETQAAIKIQAWWRGTMFRKKLGPYKKKKKKGAKDKKKALKKKTAKK